MRPTIPTAALLATFVLVPVARADDSADRAEQAAARAEAAATRSEAAAARTEKAIDHLERVLDQLARHPERGTAPSNRPATR